MSVAKVAGVAVTACTPLAAKTFAKAGGIRNKTTAESNVLSDMEQQPTAPLMSRTHVIEKLKEKDADVLANMKEFRP